MRPGNPPDTTIDTAEFARRESKLEGSIAVHAFARMREMLASERGELRWSLRGEHRTRHDGGHDDFLALSLDARVDLPCTRCLRPVAVRIHESRRFRLFATESQALAEDAQVDDHDALVHDTRFDPVVLVEDEAILALPIAPRHTDCGLAGEAESAPTAGLGEPARDSPFAVLASLRPGAKRR